MRVNDREVLACVTNVRRAGRRGVGGAARQPRRSSATSSWTWCRSCAVQAIAGAPLVRESEALPGRTRPRASDARRGTRTASSAGSASRRARSPGSDPRLPRAGRARRRVARRRGATRRRASRPCSGSPTTRTGAGAATSRSNAPRPARRTSIPPARSCGCAGRPIGARFRRAFGGRAREAGDERARRRRRDRHPGRGRSAGGESRAGSTPRGRRLGGCAFILNRVTGLGILLYLYLHLVILSLLADGPAAPGIRFVDLALSPTFLVIDVVLHLRAAVPRPQRHPRHPRRVRAHRRPPAGAASLALMHLRRDRARHRRADVHQPRGLRP